MREDGFPFAAVPDEDVGLAFLHVERLSAEDADVRKAIRGDGGVAVDAHARVRYVHGLVHPEALADRVDDGVAVGHAAGALITIHSFASKRPRALGSLSTSALARLCSNAIALSVVGPVSARAAELATAKSAIAAAATKFR